MKTRKWPVGVDPRRTRRRENAAERRATYALRTVEDQLALLGQRPGESRHERRRLFNKNLREEK